MITSLTKTLFLLSLLPFLTVAVGGALIAIYLLLGKPYAQSQTSYSVVAHLDPLRLFGFTLAFFLGVVISLLQLRRTT